MKHFEFVSEMWELNILHQKYMYISRNSLYSYIYTWADTDPMCTVILGTTKAGEWFQTIFSSLF